MLIYRCQLYHHGTQMRQIGQVTADIATHRQMN